jgi:hypothetical protein
MVGSVSINQLNDGSEGSSEKTWPISVAVLATGEIGTAEEVGCWPQIRGPMAAPRGAQMLSADQCRAYATQYKLLGSDPKNSARRRTVLINISRSWSALAKQFDSLSDIVKSEGR